MSNEKDDREEGQSSLEDFFASTNGHDGRPNETNKAEESRDSHKKTSESDITAKNAQDDGEETTEDELDEDVDVAPMDRVGKLDTPKDLPPSYLLSVDYAGPERKAIIRLYNPEKKKIYFWFDNTGHKPFCYTDLPVQAAESIARRHQGFISAEEVELIDLLSDEKRKMTKISASDPLAIGGAPGAIREMLKGASGPDGVEISRAWEANIRYRNCYSYDQEIASGLLYKIENGDLLSVIPEIDKQIMKEFRAAFANESELEGIMETYSPMFFTEVPDIRRIAVDIEVYTPVKNRIPDAVTAPYPITAIGLCDNEGYNKCFLLRRKGHPEGKKGKDYPKELEVVFFDDEKEMLIEAFRIIDDYPIVLSFVGDAFDLNYLYHRAQKINIDMDKHCPIRLGRDVALLRRGIHVDLYRFLKNPSIRLYALSGAYEGYNLDSIARGLLDYGKLELSDDISSLPYYELAHYCWRDANINLRITQFDDNLLLRLIILLMRISRLSMEDVTRLGISSWIQSLFRQEHRSHNYLIPRQIDIQIAKSPDAHTEATIKDKAFKGAIVIEPVAGVHFNATVLDFASLYPTIMKKHNISYETVDCPHETCRTDPRRQVPETGHWTCKERRGMISQTIGFFRDTRVKWFKSKSKDPKLNEATKAWYSVVEKALKVFVNASYGVTGAQHFELFCMPAAESVTAYGRNAIIKAKEKAESMGIRVLYGDTDSVFLDSPSVEQQQELIEWSRGELGIDLEVEKTYKYVALSERKKNYIGVYPSGYVEVKGLSGKKRNTPDFAQDAFRQMLEILSKVDSVEGFESAKEEVREVINCVLDRLEGKADPYSPEELAYRVQMTKPLSQYGKTVPQHVRAAKILREAGHDVPPGTIVEYIKVKGDPSVIPVPLALEASYWIDKDKYLDTLRSVFEQVLDSVGIDFEELLGFTTLDQFF
ncbi:MAG: DNA-directed DNA polymerase I [Candidatus Thorarchaeota archaeon]|nr:MAG: DNA-directed DNA polymerase I [Candidatus Thorarchaeota archaeon]